MTDDKQDIPPNSNTRRKLLRGSFAAPVVLTVHSGAAQATTSVGACLARANANPLTSGTGVKGVEDTFFRYKLWALVKSNNPNVIFSYWVVGSELSVYKRNSQSPFLDSGKYQQFDLANNVLISNVVSAAPTKTDYTFKVISKWVVLRVNSSGKIVSVGSAGGGAPVSDSCWNSFAVASVK